MLLLTNDNELEELVAGALSEVGGISHLTRDAGDALETICGVNDLDLAVIDFEHGPHGMTLLSAISTLREDIPVIVITRDDEQHVEALAYANGATACFSKQATGDTTREAIRTLRNSKLEQACCLSEEERQCKNEGQRFSRTEQDPASKKCRDRAPASAKPIIRITLTTICGTDLHICAANIQ